MGSFLERFIGALILCMILGAMVLIGTIGFFFALGIVAVVAFIQFLRLKGVIGPSRDTAFSFDKESFRADAEHGVKIIETEYHVVQTTKEEKKS